jgi:coenzyme F420-0:L-glutamate ligase/coenzyme F420-1:gamma-L-glutamate ligase
MLRLTSLENFPLIRQDDDLADIILNSLQKNKIELEDNDILVVAQKIVSKAEGRMMDLKTVTPSQRAIELASQTEKDARLIELILQESNEILRTRIGTIIVELNLGLVCANAGIDLSNVDEDKASEWVLVLPLDPDLSSRRIRNAIET